TVGAARGDGRRGAGVRTPTVRRTRSRVLHAAAVQCPVLDPPRCRRPRPETSAPLRAGRLLRCTGDGGAHDRPRRRLRRPRQTGSSEPGTAWRARARCCTPSVRSEHSTARVTLPARPGLPPSSLDVTRPVAEHAAMRFVTASLVTALALVVASVPAQGTRADYERASTIGARWGHLVPGGRIDATWLPDGRLWYRVARGGGGHEWFVVDPERGERRPLFDRAALAKALAEAS